MDNSDGASTDSAGARLRKAFHLADHLELTRQDRLQFTEALLWRDVRSWKDLTDDEVKRVLDALEGFVFLNHLLTTRVS